MNIDERPLPLPLQVRKTALAILHAGKASHLGSSMSMIEMLIAAYGSADIKKIRDHAPDRDRIFVSKGHSAAAVYSVMHHYGLIDDDTIRTYHKDGSLLAGHVSHGAPYVEHSTGALGHGISVATGCALGLKSKGYENAKVFALLGDGELQEGSVWEAIMFANHNRLSNLILMIDNNKISSITSTADVINLNPLARRFAAFGLMVQEIDGHDVEALLTAIAICRQNERPSVLVCNTVKGKGISFAENEPIWHYRSLNDDTYREAMKTLDRRDA